MDRWRRLLFLNVILASQAQELNEACTTPANAAGTCIAVRNCQPYLSVLRSQGATPEITAFLRKAACGWDANQPLVCCPNAETRSASSTESPTKPVVPVLPSNSPFLRSPSCGKTLLGNSRVVNGSPARLGEFPWIVALGYRNAKNPDQPKWLCGGTLITDRHVLTAAHCVYNRPDLYIARLGDLDLFSDEDKAQPTTLTFASAKIHESYNPSGAVNDIAILTLSESNTNPTVRPICLTVDEPLRSRNWVSYRLFIVGWGSVQFNGPASSILQMAQLPVVSNEDCSQAFINFKSTTIDNRVLCAGFAEGGTDACQGDSGGPFMYAMVENGNFTFYQIGVVSYGYRCALEGYPGVYTRITSFLDWIEQNIN